MGLKENFLCIDCKQEFPRGLDVETDVFLGDLVLDALENEEKSGARCVYCYNKNHPAHQLNIDQCWHHAYNLGEYGVAILPGEVGKTWEEIEG